MIPDIKALFFDLDGTLADTIPAITEGVNMTLEALELPHRSEEDVKSFIGRGPRHLISKSIPSEVKLENPEIVDLALEIYNKMYEKTYMHTTELYKGLYDVLVLLSKHYTIAVLSNKQDVYVKELVDQLLPDGICVMACGSLDGIPAKPSPAIALQMAERLGLKPYECMLIGDSEIDILTAHNAGFGTLSVSWGYASHKHLSLSGANNIVSSPEELIKYLN